MFLAYSFETEMLKFMEFMFDTWFEMLIYFWNVDVYIIFSEALHIRKFVFHSSMFDPLLANLL